MSEGPIKNKELAVLVNLALGSASHIPKALQRTFGDRRPRESIAVQEALASTLLARLRKCSFDESRNMPIDAKLTLLGLFTSWAQECEHHDLMEETIRALRE